ncbi:hypothetical protein O7N05_002968 [Salmonella enterica]|nr:hypothetical protein [Salmonella enterica]EDS8693683.1 hypothetical protein [Salmonella enterica]EEO0182241.1 hypothetical protein [Salmonella enterica]EKH2894697.1 hypothetical protein [Salmonella enterica]EKS2955348.1 hypothetical protein [Salmonella enterica]
MNNRPSSVTAKTAKTAKTANRKKRTQNKQGSHVWVSLIGNFTDAESNTDDGCKRRFMVDAAWVPGGCSGQVITLYYGRHLSNLIETVPKDCPVELSGVRVTNKGTHSYASATDSFAVDGRMGTKAIRASSSNYKKKPATRPLTARTPRNKAVKGRFK